MRFHRQSHYRSGRLLACYLPLGDPQLPANLVEIYVDCQVDIIEIGFPNSDPRLDGPLIRDSMARTIAFGVTPARWRRLLSRLRCEFPSTYLVAMGYEDLMPYVISQSGEPLVNAVLPVGAAARATSPEMHAGLERAVFVSGRLEEQELAAARDATAYVMLQANEGKTGLRTSLPDKNGARILCLRKSGVAVPILLGVGISSASHCRKAIKIGADGVVIGSACVDAAIKGEDAIRQFVMGVRAALDD